MTVCGFCNVQAVVSVNLSETPLSEFGHQHQLALDSEREPTARRQR